MSFRRDSAKRCRRRNKSLDPSSSFLKRTRNKRRPRKKRLKKRRNQRQRGLKVSWESFSLLFWDLKKAQKCFIFWQTSVKDNGDSMKEWILRYAEQSEDQSSEEDENQDSSVFNPELEEKFDPVSFTLVCFPHYDAITSAASRKFSHSSCRMTDTCCWPLSCMMPRRWPQSLKPRKTSWDRGQHKIGSESSSKVSAVFSTLFRVFVLFKECEKMLPLTCLLTVFVYITEMKSLESHPMFNSAIKVKDTPKEEKKPVALTDGKEELNFNLFEQADAPPAEKSKRISV